MSIKDTNVTLMAKNMDKSISFYQSIGFELKQRWSNHYAQLAAPGIVIALHPANENNYTGSGNISIGFTTDNFEETKLLLSNLQIETATREEEGGRFIHFADPDGAALYFIEPKWH